MKTTLHTRAIWAIARKDLLAVTRSKAVMIPMIIVPVLMMVLIPGILAIVVQSVDLAPNLGGNLQTYLHHLPGNMQSAFVGLNEKQTMLTLLLLYLFAPMFLIIPLMVSCVIAADSLAGEKERKTLEALLYTPTSDLDVYLAKVISSLLPALAISLLSFILYGLVANSVGWPLMHRLFFPNLTWLVLLFWVSPAAAGLGLGFTVWISARVNTFQEANQLAGMVVIPVVLLLIGQATGVIYLSVWVVMLLGLVLWGLDVLLFWIGGRTLQRSELLARL